MASRRRQRYPIDLPSVAASVIFCTVRCRAFADVARVKKQDTLADVYEGFILLLQEYAEDCGAGIRGRVLIDPVSFP